MVLFPFNSHVQNRQQYKLTLTFAVVCHFDVRIADRLLSKFVLSYVGFAVRPAHWPGYHTFHLSIGLHLADCSRGTYGLVVTNVHCKFYQKLIFI